MLPGEEVGGVDMVVAEQAELGGVGTAVENRNLLVAEVAGNGIFGRGFGSYHS